jgi:hypothetical protein
MVDHGPRRLGGVAVPRCSARPPSTSPTSAHPIRRPSRRRSPALGNVAHRGTTPPSPPARRPRAGRSPLAVGRLAQRLELPVGAAVHPAGCGSPDTARTASASPPTAGAPATAPSEHRQPHGGEAARLGPVPQVDHNVRDRHVELLPAPARRSSSPTSSTLRRWVEITIVGVDSNSASRSPAPVAGHRPARLDATRLQVLDRPGQPLPAPSRPCRRPRTGAAAACSGPARRPAPRPARPRAPQIMSSSRPATVSLATTRIRRSAMAGH